MMASRSAHQIAAAVRSGAARPGDAALASLRAIEALDGTYNAFLAVSRTALTQAAASEADAARKGILAGVPVAIKDLVDTAGLTTTYGSTIFRDHVPVEDDLVVSRLKAAGAFVIGKTMTPEFGFGAICANQLKPPTRNPWRSDLTSGGSSGGAAVAVATGMVPLAQGTDFGGSVRTPASFCGVVSLRPTPGVVPNPKRALAFDTLSTHGVMARTVDDCILFLDAVAGPDPRDPTSLRALASAQPNSAIQDAPLRIAATEDFGVAPVSAAVRLAMRKAVGVVESAIGRVRWTHPDCSGAIEAFRTLRQPVIRHTYGPLLARYAEALSPTVRWAIDQGRDVLATDLLAAETCRSRLYRDFIHLFASCDVLLAPAASVLPWPNTVEDVTEIDGRPLETLIDYLAVTFIVSLVGCPVVTLPTWTAGDLPFGIQLIGPPGSDHRLLEVARRFESACAFEFRPPPGLERMFQPDPGTTRPS